MTADTQVQRINAIQERLRRDGQVTIRDLAAQYAVSTMTIRRDLEKLEAQGLLVRTFRGGMAVPQAAGTRQAEQVESAAPVKQAIGKLAASLIEPGQTILVDAGTTTLEVVRHLPADREIMLVTNAPIAAQIASDRGIRSLLLGGYLYPVDGRTHGPLTEASLAGLRADLFFVGCVSAGSRHGFFMADLYLTSNVRAMMRIADRTVVVAESRKFLQRALSCFAEPAEIHAVVTDGGLAAEERMALEEQGVRMLITE